MRLLGGGRDSCMGPIAVLARVNASQCSIRDAMTIVMSYPPVFNLALDLSSRYRVNQQGCSRCGELLLQICLGGVASVRDNPIASTHCQSEHRFVAD